MAADTSFAMDWLGQVPQLPLVVSCLTRPLVDEKFVRIIHCFFLC